jgi:hypothetical protein
MALPAVGTSNVGMRYTGSALGEACDVLQSTNISLASLCTGGTYNGIQNTFGSQGGPAMDMSNVPLTVEVAPFAMSETFGGVHSTGGGGGGGGGSDPPFP